MHLGMMKLISSISIGQMTKSKIKLAVDLLDAYFLNMQVYIQLSMINLSVLNLTSLISDSEVHLFTKV